MYIFLFFFFNDTATTEIYPLSLHDAFPIFLFLVDQADDVEHRQFIRGKNLEDQVEAFEDGTASAEPDEFPGIRHQPLDRKSTRLNSSHQIISYAVFCLKKKNTSQRHTTAQS